MIHSRFFLAFTAVFMAASAGSFAQGSQVNLETLAALERQIVKVGKRVAPATVGVRAGRGLEGSGVIVSADGLVLTAAHVFRRPKDRVRIILPDGKSLRAVALGKEDRADFGMIRILDKGPFPFVELGDSTQLRARQLCLATGHPGGFQKGRPPVLRFGSIGRTRGPFLRSTCIINSGDSGGPLFDLEGRLIGIHSRIRNRETLNYHVPISKIRSSWKRLLNGDDWAEGPAYLGIRGADHPEGCEIEAVYRDTPARRAGLRRGDIITRIGSNEVRGIDGLVAALAKHKPREFVTISILRGDEEVEKTVRLGVAQ